MGDFKPIETIYNGYRFRSRLEARWAVFFDALGIEYEYEPEGFELSFSDDERIMYLPDFYLPESGLYAEVKGVKTRGQIPKEDAEKMSWMIDFDGPCANGIVMLGNIPDPHSHMDWAIWRHDRKGIVWGYEMNDIPTGGWDTFMQVGELESAPYYFSDTDDLMLTSSFGPDRYPYEKEEVTEITKALTKARQARFEHGETPYKGGFRS